MLVPDRMARAAQEAARRGRAEQIGAIDVLSGAFPQQLACILDPSPYKAEFCTRRAAKTYTWGLEAVNDSFTHSRARYLFLGLVREEARKMFWVDVLRDIDARHPGIGMSFNESRLEATMPNGATIVIGSADANEKEMRKLLGLKYRKIMIDEAQEWQHTNLRDLVHEVLGPATADWRGSITIAGTPGRVAKGLFFDVTQGREPGWSLHKWTTFQNPYMSAKWGEKIADLKARFPGIEETPAFRRNYLGEWVIDETNLVYKYKPGRNDFSVLPPDLPPIGWHFVLGVDLGYNDDSAFVLGAYHTASTVLYLLEAYKEKNMDITMVANRIKAYQAARAVETVVIDGANKQAVAEMANRHRLSLIPTEKVGKSDFIEIMNAEYIAGPRVLLDPNKCAPLVEEYSGLVWADKDTKREEHPACPNHAADAALYLWRYTYAYASRPITAPPKEGTKEWAEAQAAAMLEKARSKIEQAKVAQAEQFGPTEDYRDPGEAWGSGFEWG